jgi:hypothetical protein
MLLLLLLLRLLLKGLTVLLMNTRYPTPTGDPKIKLATTIFQQSTQIRLGSSCKEVEEHVKKYLIAQTCLTTSLMFLPGWQRS